MLLFIPSTERRIVCSCMKALERKGLKDSYTNGQWREGEREGERGGEVQRIQEARKACIIVLTELRERSLQMGSGRNSHTSIRGY